MTGLVITFLGLSDALAHARIERQVDPATGITTYNFRPFPDHGRDKQSPPPAQPPASPPIQPPAQPPVPRTAPETMPPRTTASTPKPTETRIAPATKLIPTSYRGFPRVSSETQRERDSERLRLLKQELAWEEEQLAQAIEGKAAGDVVQRYKANIEALNREIRNVQ